MMTSILDRPTAVGLCEGCGERVALHTYLCVFERIPDQPGQPEECWYCEHCAGLAAADWNGETVSIGPGTRYLGTVEHGNDCGQGKSTVVRHIVEDPALGSEEGAVWLVEPWGWARHFDPFPRGSSFDLRPTAFRRALPFTVAPFPRRSGGA